MSISIVNTTNFKFKISTNYKKNIYFKWSWNENTFLSTNQSITKINGIQGLYYKNGVFSQ